MKLDRTLYLTADQDRVVEEDSPEAAFLLGIEGDEVSDSEAERLGLSKKKVEPKAAEQPDDKAAAAPKNKARKTAKKK